MNYGLPSESYRDSLLESWKWYCNDHLRDDHLRLDHLRDDHLRDDHLRLDHLREEVKA